MDAKIVIKNVKERLKPFISNINRSVIYVGFVIAMIVSYYINTLGNIELKRWDRTFSSSIISGYSIDARIGNFYKLFFILLPLLSVFFILVLACLFKERGVYREYFLKLTPFFLLDTFVSFISRYSGGETEIQNNRLLQIILAYLIILYITAIIDRRQQMSFADVTRLFVFFVIFVVLLSIFFNSYDYVLRLMIAGCIILAYVLIVTSDKTREKLYIPLNRFVLAFMWLPAIARFSLEGLYLLNEKGRNTHRYYTHVLQAVLIIVALIIVVVIRRKEQQEKLTFGYIGAILSMVVMQGFNFGYQYTWSYNNYPDLYESGNPAVAMDSVLYGKLPIFDYFSAHALGDVWTRIIYSVIHNDVKGILVDPYAWILSALAFVVLFFIVKNLFNENIAVIYVLLFPGNISGIKWISICALPIAMLLYIYKKKQIRFYLCFWIAVLFGAFHTYDEGISIGIACIGTYIIIKTIQKQWNELVAFIGSGMVIGLLAVVSYICYSLVTGVSIISRVKEWISLSVKSSSSWATASFGDQTSFAFLISYFVVPITAIMLLVFVIVQFYRYREHEMIVLLTVTYALVEILFIPRTIVYHNLAVCRGMTGVLLNYIHWTVSLYVLYLFSRKELTDSIRINSWMLSMFIVMVLECSMVTQIFPEAGSVLAYKATHTVDSWKLKDDNVDNFEKDRIVFDQPTIVLINKFKTVFDTLLTKDETFLDFANVTSMYLLTGRERPCYVGQSPSLLTNLYSQKCFLNQVQNHNCPLAVLGTTETGYLQHMVGIPHNIRYYKIAEYIYAKYRPLIAFDEIVIWCDKDRYEEYKEKLSSANIYAGGYWEIDYGYDFTTPYVDNAGYMQYDFKPFHLYDLGMIPYLWANVDTFHAIESNEVVSITKNGKNSFKFDGSKSVIRAEGNYLCFNCVNSSDDSISINIVLYDSENDGAKIQYYFTVVPGDNEYIIRISQDYFWDVYNIDTILFGENKSLIVDNLRVLEGN